ncbi:MAG: hypothetical protein UU87_C0003G0203 [Parcubacteria group bacterium GW2011_GWA2_42_11]|nr:MAG: hypothetical protein UU87_C0003G0203 [Parcubacteria group bacterium GW2011_GWA2_42_11]KKT76533.1 MAG: hypothetical protein UW72_C0005G0101 [Parcubacteria group bacterium GW2011_GWF2_44_7]
MKSKILALFGIGSYILSVLSSVTDLDDNSVAPIALILISGIATLVFYFLATIRLWKIQKIVPILLIFSAILLIVLLISQSVVPLLINIIKIINVIMFIRVICLLWTIEKYKVRKIDSQINFNYRI